MNKIKTEEYINRVRMLEVKHDAQSARVSSLYTLCSNFISDPKSINAYLSLSENDMEKLLGINDVNKLYVLEGHILAVEKKDGTRFVYMPPDSDSEFGLIPAFQWNDCSSWGEFEPRWQYVGGEWKQTKDAPTSEHIIYWFRKEKSNCNFIKIETES